MTFRILLTLCTLTVLAGFFCGCETTEDTSYITITPGDVTLSSTNSTVAFSVGSSTNSDSGLRTLSLPLVWSVSNPALGNIVSSSGLGATYGRTANNGVNVVIVRDQYGAEGRATVAQE